MEKLTNGITKLSKLLDRIGGYFYFFLMFLVVFNVIGRRGFSKGFIGTIELVEIFTAVGVGLTIAYCAVQDEHITVDFVFECLPNLAKKILGIIINLLTLGFLGVTSWMVLQYGISLQQSGRVSPTLAIPYYPFLYIIAIGFFMYFLVALIKIINIYLDKEVTK